LRIPRQFSLPLQADTVSANRRIVEDRRLKYSKDEWKAKRRAEKEIKLPLLQVDIVSVQGQYKETPRKTKELRPSKIFITK